MEYNNFKIYLNNDGSFKNAVIETNFGDIEIKNEGQLKNFIETGARQKGMSIDEFKTANVKIEVDAREESRTSSVAEGIIPVEYTIRDGELIEATETGRTGDTEYYSIDGLGKKKCTIKRLLATVTALGILAGGYHLYKNQDSYENTPITFVPPQTFTDTYETGIPSTADYEVEMDRVFNNTENMTTDGFMTTLNDVSTFANANMIEVSNFINGSPIVGTAYYSNLGEMFASEVDQAAVKYFSDYRNRIIRSAYEEQNINSTRAAINSAYISLTEFILLGTPYSLPVNGHDINVSYLQLSPMAKATVLNLAMAMFTINQDYTYYAQTGAMFPKMDTLTTISDTFYNDAISQLEGTINKTR